MLIFLGAMLIMPAVSTGIYSGGDPYPGTSGYLGIHTHKAHIRHRSIEKSIFWEMADHKNKNSKADQINAVSSYEHRNMMI